MAILANVTFDLSHFKGSTEDFLQLFFNKSQDQIYGSDSPENINPYQVKLSYSAKEMFFRSLMKYYAQYTTLPKDKITITNLAEEFNIDIDQLDNDVRDGGFSFHGYQKNSYKIDGSKISFENSSICNSGSAWEIFKAFTLLGISITIDDATEQDGSNYMQQASVEFSESSQKIIVNKSKIYDIEGYASWFDWSGDRNLEELEAEDLDQFNNALEYFSDVINQYSDSKDYWRKNHKAFGSKKYFIRELIRLKNREEADDLSSIYDDIENDDEANIESEYTTYLFSWNPNAWSWDHLPETLESFKAGKTVIEPWRIKSHRKVNLGDRFFLIKLGSNEPRGIIGSGEIISLPYQQETSNGEQSPYYVDLQFNQLLDPFTQALHIDELKEINDAGKQFHWSIIASGIELPAHFAKEVEAKWNSLEYTHD